MVGQVFGLGASGLGRQAQGFAFVGLAVLGDGLSGIMVAERRGTYQTELGIEGDEATIEGFVVERVESENMYPWLTVRKTRGARCVYRKHPGTSFRQPSTNLA